LDQPYVRHNGRLQPASWSEAFDAIAARLEGVSGSRVAAIAGDLADCESMMALKDLMTALGSPHTDCRQDGAKLDSACRAGYLFNTTIAGIDKADACLLIGTNPRREAPVLNARLRKRFLAGGFAIGVIGPKDDLTYPYRHVSDDGTALRQVASGRHPFAKALKEAKKPMLILGQGALARPDGASVLALAREIAESSGMIDEKAAWNGFNVLHIAAARVGGMDLGFVPGRGGRDIAGILAGVKERQIEVVYLLGADEIDMAGLEGAFVIYQGHHGDAGAHHANVILPGATYTEKNGTYVSTEGRTQRTRLAVYPPGDAREDWTIIRALSAVLDKTLPYDDVDALRARLLKASDAFLRVDEVTTAKWGAFGKAGEIDPASFRSPIDNFYMTDPISRASKSMAECTAMSRGGDTGKTGTDG
ncbi:MAG: molybdopterin-dependent oxidoreductase, partial [Rhodospirillales bacterium]|nr:molybdopterin-dependent oxidoreductase [Rhodospirillales bacterium]